MMNERTFVVEDATATLNADFTNDTDRTVEILYIAILLQKR